MSFVVHRVAKSAARYTDAGGREKCGYCRFFVAPRACGKVIGPVSPQGWCKYFSRQVSQQGSTPIGGIPAGATLALDFMSSGNMPAGVTFSRASPASYQDASGVIQTAAVDQPRWDYAGGSLRGLLIEEARTNIALWSTDFTNAVWGLFNGATKGPLVTSPAGPSTGMTLNFSATSQSQMFQTAAITAGMTVSVWARANTLSRFHIRLASSDGASPTFNLTSQWQRFSFTSTTTAGNFAIEKIDPDVGSIDIAMPQAEQGSAASSYIPTTTASASRAFDTCYIPTAGWFNASAGTSSVEFSVAAVPPSGSQAGIARMTDMVGSSYYVIYLPQISPAVSVFGLAATVTQISTTMGNITGARQVVAVCYGGAVWKSAMGGTLYSGVGGTVPVPATRLIIGGGNDTAGVAMLNGTIRRVQYWPRTLSDAEMQAVTT